MSYIDTFSHELIGYLNRLPIYHPLENVHNDAWGGCDFSCDTSNLVMGGGACEHPGLVIHHLEALVAKYILYDDEQKTKLFADRGYESLFAQERDRLIDIAISQTNTLEFCEWSMRQIHNFVKSAESAVHCTPLAPDQSVEEWIELSIGELVHFSLPELNPLKAEMDSIVHAQWPVGYWMQNVTCPPPNYTSSKRTAILSTGANSNGWFRWDYQYPPAEISSE